MAKARHRAIQAQFGLGWPGVGGAALGDQLDLDQVALLSRELGPWILGGSRFVGPRSFRIRWAQVFGSGLACRQQIEVAWRVGGDAVARVVCVHGVGQQLETDQTLHVVWAPALCGGVGLAGGVLAE